MKKIVIGMLVALLIITSLTATIVAAEGPQTQEINSTTIQVNTNPLKTDFIFSYPDRPGEEMTIIYQVKNTSNMIEEVFYELTSDTNLGGISAFIDYDGPFGPKQSEAYNWNKVPVRPGEEQWLFVRFPIPKSYVPTLNIRPSIKRHVGERG